MSENDILYPQIGICRVQKMRVHSSPLMLNIKRIGIYQVDIYQVDRIGIYEYPVQRRIEKTLPDESRALTGTA